MFPLFCLNFAVTYQQTTPTSNICKYSSSLDKFQLDHVCNCNSAQAASVFAKGTNLVVFSSGQFGAPIVDGNCYGSSTETWDCGEDGSCTSLGLCQPVFEPYNLGTLNKSASLATCFGPGNAPCCQNKTVGDYGYVLISEGEVPSNCLSNCIYQRVDQPGSRYCFAPGEQPVICGEVECLRNIKYTGEVIPGGSGATDYEDCNKKCSETNSPKRCNYFSTTYGPIEFGCIFFSSINGTLDIWRWISGPRNCAFDFNEE